MAKYKYILTFADGEKLDSLEEYGDDNFEGTFSSYSAAEEAALDAVSCERQGAEILNWGDMMAASALVVVPSVIFFMFIQNKIAGGMTEGAVK